MWDTPNNTFPSCLPSYIASRNLAECRSSSCHDTGSSLLRESHRQFQLTRTRYSVIAPNCRYAPELYNQATTTRPLPVSDSLVGETQARLRQSIIQKLTRHRRCQPPESKRRWIVEQGSFRMINLFLNKRREIGPP